MGSFSTSSMSSILVVVVGGGKRLLLRVEKGRGEGVRGILVPSQVQFSAFVSTADMQAGRVE